jgi:hypothetical protein
MRLTGKISSAIIAIGLMSSAAHADEVVDWNQTMLRAALVAGTTPLVITRVGAIVQAAVFDVVRPKWKSRRRGPMAVRLSRL